ncbi:MAG TPA: hemerythrin domain-containing protein [Acidobacteriaceae bacterium]|jgi:hemerythrin-like domain-containing protein
MPIQIGAKPDSGFDDPIGMLTDCHRRIERFLDILSLVAERAHERTLTDEEQSAVTTSLQYFRTGGERHTADEEQSLFPRLRGQLPSPAIDRIQRLEDDHHEAAALHHSVEELYTRWIAATTLTPDEQQQLLVATRRLKQLYAEHIQIEETVVFPHAAEILKSRDLEAMKTEFIARRNSPSS